MAPENHVLKSLVGLIDARHGSIRLGGEDITACAPATGCGAHDLHVGACGVPDLSIEETSGRAQRSACDRQSRGRTLWPVSVLREKRATRLQLSGASARCSYRQGACREPKLLVMDEPRRLSRCSSRRSSES